MNKLTTINTIKKAAPLALLAVVMSGSAFAGPGKGPRGSVDVFSLCDVDVTTEGEWVFTVKADIQDASDDTSGFESVIDTTSVQVMQKGNRGPIVPIIGATGELELDTDEMSPTFGYWTAEIPFCKNNFDASSPVLNAEIEVTVVGRNKSFGGRCDDDLATNCDGDYCEEKDESIIDISYLPVCQ